MRTIHALKCWPEPYEGIASGDKTFEYRLNDRDFQEGDIVVIYRFDPETEKYTGESTVGTITYVLREGFGLPEGYCVFSFTKRDEI